MSDAQSASLSPCLGAGASFAPIPLDDELLYSVCSAFHLLSGISSSVTTRRLLYGRNHGPRDLAMTGNRLGTLAQYLSGGNPSDCEAWLWDHTMYPLWGRFLDSAENTSWLVKVSSGNGNLAQLSGVRTHQWFPEHLALCLECVNADKATTGRAYWHRSHQLPGVIRCHRHEQVLIRTCPHCGHHVDQRPSFALPAASCAYCGLEFATAKDDSYGSAAAIRYARLTSGLLANRTHIDLAAVRSEWRRQLHAAPITSWLYWCSSRYPLT